MATITKKMGKAGLSYKIQVKLRDKGSGKVITKTTTFKPPDGLNAKQIERQAILFSEQYEKEIKGMCGGSNVLSITQETLFKDYSNRWLEHVKNDLSLTYYANCVFAMKLANEHIGGYKLKELNPVVIQQFYDILDRKEKVATTVTAKGNVREVMRAKGVKYKQLRDNGVSTTSLNAMVNGRVLSLESANKIAKVIGMKTQALFNIKVTRGKYAHETMHKVKRTVRTILAQAKKQRLIQDNWASADFINFPKRPQKEIDFLRDDEAKAFYMVVAKQEDIRIKTALTLLLMTGCRRGELCGLEWGDIDLGNGTLAIKRSVVTVNGFGTITKEPKTETSKRTLAMPQLLMDTLMQYKVWYDDMATSLGDAWQNSNRLMVQWNGLPLAPGTVRTWLDKVLKQAGLEHKTVHSLRHTNITMQITAGVPIVTVSGRAGHARTSTTTDIYSHFLKSSDRIAASALDTVFGG